MTVLREMQKYRLAIPAGKGGPAVPPHVVTYTGKFDEDIACAVCGARPTRTNHNRHFFVEGDPDKPDWQWAIGTECIKRCKIEPTMECNMNTIREMIEILERDTGEKASARRMDDAVDNFLKNIQKLCGCDAKDAEKIFKVYSRERIIDRKNQMVNGELTVKHGAYMDRDVLVRAIKMYDDDEKKYKGVAVR